MRRDLAPQTSFRLISSLKNRLKMNCVRIIQRSFCSSVPVRTVPHNEWMATSHNIEKCLFSRFIPDSEYVERQQKLVSLVGDKLEYKNKSSLMLIPSAQRSFQADTKIPAIYYKQNADFTYFTGLNTLEAVNCVLAILGGNGEPKESILFTPVADEYQLIWEGPGMKSLTDRAICDDVRDIKELDYFLQSNITRQIFVSKYGLNPQKNGSATKSENGRIWTQLNQFSAVHSQLSNFIDELRLIKSSNELKSMRRTCLIGSKALKETMQWTANIHERNDHLFSIPLLNENQIAAKFDYECRMNGASKLSYPSVCASGERSTIIHYGANNRFANPNEWILMDAGCEDIEGYTSDITRSWQLDGKKDLSRLEYALYQALQEVHKEIVASMSQSLMSLDSLFELMCHLIAKILVAFGVGGASMSSTEAFRLAYRYCPHHVSHYIGLDIHDTPSISRNIPVKPGMCFTIEPGLYFRKNDPDVRPEFHGIGLRIEDDFCINEDGKLENLTQTCPYI